MYVHFVMAMVYFLTNKTSRHTYAAKSIKFANAMCRHTYVHISTQMHTDALYKDLGPSGRCGGHSHSSTLLLNACASTWRYDMDDMTPRTFHIGQSNLKICSPRFIQFDSIRLHSLQFDSTRFNSIRVTSIQFNMHTSNVKNSFEIQQIDI